MVSPCLSSGSPQTVDAHDVALVSVVGVWRRQEQQSSKDADLVKTYKGELEFPDMTNSDVDNETFDSDVSERGRGLYVAAQQH